jgi:DNA-binding PadR family transcriptional regulator
VSSRDLTPVSYVVLGLLSRDGPSTAYELKTAVGRGIAAFWPFPHSQIYAEAEHLAGLGLLGAEQEQRGRRRRIYRITRAGEAALRAWLAAPMADEAQFRSLALLKLFFGQFAEPEHIVALAAAQRLKLEQLFVRFAEIIARLEARGDRRWQLAVAELLFAAHRAMAQHWKQIEQVAARAERGAPRAPRRARAEVKERAKRARKPTPVKRSRARPRAAQRSVSRP